MLAHIATIISLLSVPTLASVQIQLDSGVGITYLGEPASYVPQKGFISGDGDYNDVVKPFMLNIPSAGTPTCQILGKMNIRPGTVDEPQVNFFIHNSTNYLEPCGHEKTYGIAMVCDGPRATCQTEG